MKEYKKLDKRIKSSWRLARIIVFLVFAAFFIFAIIFFRFQNYWNSIKIYVFMVIGSVLFYLLINAFVFPHIEYMRWKYFISNKAIFIEKGIFFTSSYTIPIKKIQHISISHGPINRYYGLSNILIYTSSGVFEIKGLKEDICIKLCQIIENKAMN